MNKTHSKGGGGVQLDVCATRLDNNIVAGESAKIAVNGLGKHSAQQIALACQNPEPRRFQGELQEKETKLVPNTNLFIITKNKPFL
jgi:hypothetical protein